MIVKRGKIQTETPPIKRDRGFPGRLAACRYRLRSRFLGCTLRRRLLKHIKAKLLTLLGNIGC
jgi:hypothetical protein